MSKKKYVYWPEGKPLPFDENKLRNLLQNPKFTIENKDEVSNLNCIKPTCIDHIHFFIRDPQRTLEFYQNVFGFRLYESDAENGFIILGDENIMLCCIQNSGIENYHTDGFYHFGFHIQDYELTKDILNKSAIFFKESEWEHSRSLYIKDPDGYTIKLSEVKGGGLK
ncbi:MAG: VOC family protein [Saprospiraceae bacterium]|nr:VOC family protein [Saprospiraceae bacterium]